MQELKAFNEQRAEIYWWLSSVFSRELSSEELEKYQGQTIRSFLSGLAENATLSSAIQDFTDALNRLQTREDAQLELAADFCHLFLQTDKKSALPYASLYLGQSGLLNDVPAQEMEQVMARHNIAVSEQLKEPADHIAIELDFFGNLIIHSNKAETEQALEDGLQEQAAFITQHLLSWLPQFEQKCIENDEFGFYSALSRLLVNFCKLDLDYLQGNAEK